MHRLLALRDLVHDFIDRTTNLVEETHDSVGQKPLELLSQAAAVGETVRAVDGVRRATATAVFAAIRATNQSVRIVGDASITAAVTAARNAGFLEKDGPIGALSEAPAFGTLSTWADLAQGALNGAVGDFLHQKDNALGIQMGFYADGRPVDLGDAARALPDATDELCIFVHGLGCTEWAWSLLGEQFHGEPGASFGSLLRRDRGSTSAYVRYNTGLHVSQNGRLLSALISELVLAYPRPLSRIILVGHSMGGLVSRSAIHYGRLEDEEWVSKVSHVFCIGSPHLGAPLEKASHVFASVLSYFDTPGTQVPAKILNGRSAGVKDLRYGYIVDEDWHGRDPDGFMEDNRTDVPFLPAATYCFIASSLTRDPEHPVGQYLGDVLVRLPSALGYAPEPARSVPFHVARVIGGAHHLELMNHPEVYGEIVRCLGREPGARALPMGALEGGPT